MLEEILVEKLAVLTWRYRRLLAAEAGEIRKNTEFLEWDEDCRQIENVADIADDELIRHIANPKILERCVELLRELHHNIKTDGFDSEWDHEILDKLYGDEPLQKTIKEDYATWSGRADRSDDDDDDDDDDEEEEEEEEEERQKGEYASPEQCVTNFLHVISNEIKRLVSYNRAQKHVDTEKTELDKLRGSVPGLPDMDRLLRYEATINREIDRTLNQLERAQRMRLGQPVPLPSK